jgi:hypothetical protein
MDPKIQHWRFHNNFQRLSNDISKRIRDYAISVMRSIRETLRRLYADTEQPDERDVGNC